MTIRDVFKCVVLLAACLAVPADGQRLIVLPGAGSTASTATAFAANPFASIGSISAGPGAFLAFSNPAGSQYFIVTTSGVYVVDSSGAQVQAPLAIEQTVTGAALSPDGSKLAVVAGNSTSGSLTVFDVTGNNATQSAVVALGNRPLDVAISLDSTMAYVLDVTGLTPVDLTTNTVGTPIALAGLGLTGSAKPGVAVGPNGLVYVNAKSAVYEIHPGTLATLNTIGVGGFPGKLSFNNSATSAVAVNQLWGDPQATVLNLVNHSISTTLTGLQLQMHHVFFVAPDLIYGVSSTLQYLYSFSPVSPNYTLKPLINSIFTGAVSNEHAPKYLFAVGAKGITRLDITAATPTPVTVPLVTPAGPSFYVEPANEGTPSAAVVYNGTQKLASGAASLPLVVKLLDKNGHALSNQPVSWSSALTLRNKMTTTNAQGVVTATALLPTASNTYNVTASFPGTAVNNVIFALTVGTSDGGGSGGGTGPTGGISMVSGNGQVAQSNTSIGEPLVVAVNDASGNPVAGAAVTFTVASAATSSGGTSSALGMLFAGTDTSQGCKYTSITAVACTTDSKGLASIFYQAPLVPPSFSSVILSTITAKTSSTTTATGGSVSFLVTSFPVYGTGALIPQMSSLAPSGTTLTGEAGQTLKAAIQIQATGLLSAQPVPNIGLAVRPTLHYQIGGSSPATCAGAGGTALTNANGIATCDLVLGNLPGTYALYRIGGGFDVVVYTLTIKPATAPAPVPTTIQVASGDNQSGVVGKPLTNPLVAVVKDQTGAVMANTTVTWTVLQGSATVLNQSTKTNAQGQTSNTVTLGATPGAGQIKVTAGSATGIFKFTGTIAITAITKLSGDAQTAVVGTGFAAPVTVQVNTAQGAAASFPVAFAATGGAALSASSVNTNASGQASVTVTAGPNAGPVQVTATAGGQTVTFNLTARLPGPELTLASFVNGASFQPGFAFGSIATIKAKGLTTGLDLTPGTCFTDGSLDGLPMTGGLPTRLGGVEIQFGSILAPIFAICLNADGSEQANVQAPFELAPAKVGVTIRYGAGTSSKTEFFIGDVPVLNAAPGIFEYMADASTKVAVATKPDGSVVSPSNPAHPGDTIQVYTTGFGPVLPHVETNKPGVPGQVPFFTPAATLGGTPMGGVTAEYAGNMIGVFVVTFQIPSSQATGAAVPLTIGVVKDDKTTATSQTSQIAISK